MTTDLEQYSLNNIYQNDRLYDYLPESAKADKSLAMDLLKYSYDCDALFSKFSDTFKNDTQLVSILIVATDDLGASFQFVGEAIKNNKAFILNLMMERRSNNLIQYVSEAMRDDVDVVKFAIDIDAPNVSSLQYASTRIRAMQSIVDFAVARLPSAIEWSLVNPANQ